MAHYCNLTLYGVNAQFDIITARNELRKVLFLALILFCLCMKYPKPLNGFAANSHGRCVWLLARTSLKVTCVRFMFGKTWPATHQYPKPCQISSMSAKRCTRKALQFFTPLTFWGPRGLLGQSSPVWVVTYIKATVFHAAKFRPLPTTRLRDICCQSSSIWWTEW